MLRWGVLGTASIAKRRLIPALHASTANEVVAVGSRDGERAKAFALLTGIGCAHGSYEALLDDPAVDAIYIPLPNHLHLEWSLRALAAGKHVLCEKPIGLNAVEATTLRSAAAVHPQLVVMEAFMYRCHPRWQAIRTLVRTGMIGALGAIHTSFGYDNQDATNIRNIQEMGGGAWLDIGCYGVSVARFLFDDEPRTVSGTRRVAQDFGTDVLTSAVLEFEHGIATVTCATQLAWHQSVTILGSTGRIDVPLPFNPPGDAATQIALQREGNTEQLTFPACDQFLEEVDQFAATVRGSRAIPVTLTDSVANMRSLDAIHDATPAVVAREDGTA